MEYPEHLYKYRYFDEKGLHLRMLTHNEIFFPSPARFNDPFDCQISMNFSDATKEEILCYWEKRINDSQVSLRPGDSLEELYEKGFFSSPIARKLARESTKNISAKILGIFSLTSNNSNILMWSHYSSSHTGFVIGFRTQGLKDFCSKCIYNKKNIIAMDIIRYSSLMPIINAYRRSYNERFNLQVLTKAIDWQYENEYRMLKQNGPDTTEILPSNVFSYVFVGCRIEQNNLDKIIQVLRDREDQLPLFQARTSETKFGIEFEQIEY